MKRSEQIVLVLSGAMAGALAGCGDPNEMKLSTGTVYTNDHYVPGAGYYHAPYHAWFPHRYNSYDPARGYYYGGNWNPYPAPTGSATASQPSPGAVRQASAEHHTHASGTRRGGFGSSSRSSVS